MTSDKLLAATSAGFATLSGLTLQDWAAVAAIIAGAASAAVSFKKLITRPRHV